jgi:hypothetical protein
MTESVMVMIPLLLTFLSVLQVSTGVMARTVATNVVQGSAARSAMQSTGQPVLQSTHQTAHQTASTTIGQGSPQQDSLEEVPLPGGGTITITHRAIHQTAITPLLPGGDNFEATGIALTE